MLTRTIGYPHPQLGRTHGIAHGLAALTVVMSLFFILALSAAYTNRSIVFEQRMAAGSVRSERAIAAADSAVDWALLMLNDGKIDSHCQISEQGASNFRDRYLAMDPAVGGYAGRSNVLKPAFAGCRANGTALYCTCPSPGGALGSIDLGSPEDASFRISFSVPRPDLTVSTSQQTPPGTVMLQVRGCSNAGTGLAACYGYSEPNVDSRINVRANLGLLRALAVPPKATLTSGGAINASAVTVTAANGDNQTGLVLHAGGAIPSGVNINLLGPAGAGNVNLSLQDQLLDDLRNKGTFFETMFGMSRALFARQPGIVAIECGGAACTQDNLADRHWLTTYAGKVVYVNGDLNLTSPPNPANAGTDASPIMLVVNGTLTVTAGIEFVGFIYADTINWNAGAAGASVRGAMVAGNVFNANADLKLVYDATVLNLIRMGYGSFVRVPGG